MNVPLSYNNRIHIDDIDLKILQNFYNLKKNEQITTYQIGLNIFKDEMKDRYEKISKNNLITKKLLRLSHYGFIEINKYGQSKSFDLIADSISIKQIKIKKLKITGKAMFLKINGCWNIFVRDFFDSYNPKIITKV